MLLKKQKLDFLKANFGIKLVTFCFFENIKKEKEKLLI